MTEVKLGYRGVEGGVARSAKLTPEERREIASKAAKARWAAHPKPTKPTASASAIKKSRVNRSLTIEERRAPASAGIEHESVTVTISEFGSVLKTFYGTGRTPWWKMVGYLEALRDTGFVLAIENKSEIAL